MSNKRISAKAIITAVIEATGIKPEYVQLSKYEGEYYWSGKVGSVFSSANTYNRKLTDSTIEDWVKGFASQVEDTIEFTEHKHINDYIESINWEVEFDIMTEDY